MEYKYDKKVVNKLIDDAMKSWTKCHYVNEPKEGPLFVTKEGKIIWGETTHSSIVDKLGIGLFYATKIEGLTYLTMWEFFEKELGWIRCNSGTLGYEGATYIAIDKDAKPTEEQYTTLEDIVYYYLGTLKKKYVEVWIVSNGSSNIDERKNYYQEYDTPEDVIKSIKRYFQNGLLEGFLPFDDKHIQLQEKIVRKGNKWQVQSEKGKNLGTYDTKEEAEKRLKQVHYFKHINESSKYAPSEELLKECGELVYHATYKSELDKIYKEGLHDFWFGIDDYECLDMIEYNHHKNDEEVIIAIPTKYLDPSKCDFASDNGNGWSDNWAGTGIYGGTITKDKFEYIYDVDNEDYIEESLKHINEDAQENVEDIALNVFGEGKLEKGPMYLLPNGKLLNIPEPKQIGLGAFIQYRCHACVNAWLLYKKLIPGTLWDMNDETPLLDRGWVRGNLGKLPDSQAIMNYIETPKQRITDAQYKTILEWLDYAQTIGVKSIEVNTEGMGRYKSYSFSDYTSDEIVDKIKKYYGTGRLEESINVNILYDKKDLIENLLKEKYEVENFSNQKSSLILKDGTIIQCEFHPDLIDYLCETGKFTEEEMNVFDYYSGEIFPMILGCTRETMGNYENYISLPLSCTDAQYKKIIEWLDLDSQHHKYVIVLTDGTRDTNYTSSDYKKYNYSDYTSDEIVAKIKKYYATNRLEEDLKKVILSDDAFEEFNIGGADFPSDYQDYDNMDYYGILDSNDYELVGNIAIRNEGDYVVIEGIDIFAKGLGYGRATIEEVKKEYPKATQIQLYAIPEAVGFYERLGFTNHGEDEATETFFMSLNYGKLNEEVDLIQETDSEGNILSPEQIEFFKNSKVRDDKGRLLVCYHGTNANFDTFDKNKQRDGAYGKGFYFTTNKGDAEEHGDIIKKVYLNASKIYFCNDSNCESQISPFLKEQGISIEDIHSKNIDNIYDEIDSEIIDSAIQKAGFDIKQSYIDEYIAFYPNQIKSIDNKTPTNSDNINEELSQQQQEFFKDSKVRDKNGNLIVCYHGTPNPGFKEFSPKSNKSQFGGYKFDNYNVNYFTTDKDAAVSFTEMGVERDGNVYACYLNITNPYIVNNKTEANLRTSFNIKDDELRKHQLELFDKIFNKWKGRFISYGDYEFKELNKDLHTLNLELRPSEIYADDTDDEDKDIFDLFYLGNNSFFGAEHPIEPSYTIDELFDDDMYDQLKEDILGISKEYGDDYFFSTDDIVRYVISLNETKGTNYDGIVIPDIYDSKSMFGLRGTDYITLKSSNQIKLITNLNPTTSNRIDEDASEGQILNNALSFTVEDIKKYSNSLISSNYVSCGPAFILPDGNFILSGKKFKTHQDYVEDIISYFSPDVVFSDRLESIITNIFTKKFNLLRVNDGSDKVVEPRAYFVVKPEIIITPKQWESLEQFIDYVEENRFSLKAYEIIGIVRDIYKKWKTTFEPFPSGYEIVEQCKQAYRTGHFLESLEESTVEKITQTQEDFFKKSVVRDSKGDLLPVYHSTWNKFNAFIEDRSLIWFAEEESYSKSYGEITLACYINITNPLKIGDINYYLDELDDDETDTIEFETYSGEVLEIIIPNCVYELSRQANCSVDKLIQCYDNWCGQYYTDEESELTYMTGNLFDITNSPDFKKILVDKGYDGVIAYEGGHKTYGIVKSNQAKLITNTDPTNSENINEELNNKDEIISVLKKIYAKKEPPSRCFILEDGTFIDVIGGDLPHAATADYLYKLGLVDKDFITSDLKGYADDTKLISLIKAITCNGYGEFYFRLLKDRPTDAQFKSLALWLDKYYTEHFPPYSIKAEIAKTEDLYKGEMITQLYNPKETTVDEIIKKLKKYYITGYLEENINNAHVSGLNEELLLEKSRNELIRKSQKGANYKTDQSKGKNRWERKKYSKVANFVREFNSIDMNTFFKKDILNVVIPVKGETDNYQVKIKFNGVLDELRRIVKLNDNVLDYKSIMQSLTRTFNEKDVYVWCSCPDHKYRFDYWCTIQDYNSGKPQLEPTDETNPGDSLGAACKHVNLVLSNLFWLMKVASVINNYIHFAEENMQRQFAEIIFPTIYGVQYPKAVQMGLFDRMYLKHSKGVIDYINSQSARGGYRKKNTKPEPEEEVKVTQPFKQPNILNKTEKEEQTITNKTVQPKFTSNANKTEQPKFSSQPKQLSIFDTDEEEITEK